MVALCSQRHMLVVEVSPIRQSPPSPELRFFFLERTKLYVVCAASMVNYPTNEEAYHRRKSTDSSKQLPEFLVVIHLSKISI